MNDAIFLGHTVNKIKAHNMRAVLLSLLHHEPTYRARLAAETSLSTTTITNLIDELIQLGIVEEGGELQSDGRRRVGRPRSALRLIPDARYAIGVHVSVGSYRIGLANLKGEIIYEEENTFDVDQESEAVMAGMVQRVQASIQASGIERQRIIGVGLGVAGLIDTQRGLVHFSPNLGWNDVAIGPFFQAQLNLPVIVDNNVKSMALGEAFFGLGRDVRSLVFVYSRLGLGAGIVIDNRIVRGSDVGAGEIGHTIMMADGGKLCRCGNHGCLETLASEKVLVERATALSQEHPDSVLAHHLHREADGRQEHAGPERAVVRVFDAAREGDPWAQQAIGEVARYLGFALSNLINLINPEMILLGGMFALGEDLFMPELERIIQETAFARMGDGVRLLATEFGAQVSIVGAASLALTAYFYLSPEEVA